MLTKAQWEWIAASRVLSRQRASIAVQEERLDRLLSSADQAMANAFTGGFRVAQTKLAISKVLPAESMASAALESAQIVALAILVREQMSQGEFSAHYRPFATVLPGPGYESPPAIDRQIALFMEFVPTLNGDAKTEVMAVSKALAEPTGDDDGCRRPARGGGSCPGLHGPSDVFSRLEGRHRTGTHIGPDDLVPSGSGPGRAGGAP